jgi:alpha-L-rhamnosidase
MSQLSFSKYSAQLVIVFCMFIVLTCVHCTDRKKIEIVSLKCEYVSNPSGIDVEQPRFGWILRSTQRGQKQTAYQILVASSRDLIKRNMGDLWDSRKVKSNQSTLIRYKGQSLSTAQTYFWKVRVWDKDNEESQFSNLAQFITSILNAQEWQANWIGKSGGKDPIPEGIYYSPQPEIDSEGDSIRYNARSVLLRKELELSKTVAKALVFVTGLGYYELFINGQKVGDNILTPAKTDYRKIILYDTYDVTRWLKTNRFAIGLMLGNGWFNPLKKWWSWRMQWFGAKRAMLQMHVTFIDGSTEIITSDESWKIANGPILSSCIYDGEIYDANQELPGWKKPDFDDSSWENVKIVDAPGGKLSSQIMPSIKVTQTIRPKKIIQPKKNIYVFDMGQNFSGWVKLYLKGKKGSQVQLRYAENLQQDGNIDVRSNNLALATDTYILRGEGIEAYQPRFTYHGFRYVEISGLENEPELNSIEGIVVHSAVEPTGKFSSNNRRINKIQQAILWSQRANLMGFPTDCPQRDERLGWLGDAHVTAEEAIYNFNMAQFYRKFLDDIKSTQNFHNGDIPYIAPRPFTDGVGDPAWSSGYHLIVWYLYQYYGDQQILLDHFESMKKYVDYLSSQATDFILPMDKYGDWASANKDGWWKRGQPLSTSTGFFYYTSGIVAKAARVLGREKDEKKYSQLVRKIKHVYQDRFFNSHEKQYENATQFSNSFPLFLNIIPKNEKDAVLSNLIADILKHRGHLTTGILGTKYMMETLSRENRSDMAYLLANQIEYPGWDNMLGDRTTLSEHWNQAGSNNHIMFGSVGSWFYKVLAGINVDENAPGFENIIIKPYIAPNMHRVKASVKTVRGTVSSEWELLENMFKLKIKIPVNSTGTVYVLAKKSMKVKESNVTAGTASGVSFLSMEGKHAVYFVESGEYTFTSPDVDDLLDLPYVSNPIIFPADTFIYQPDNATVSIKTETIGSKIYYTLDGSEPTEKSVLYELPFGLENNVIIKAKAFKRGYNSSFPQTSKIHFVDPQKNGVFFRLYHGAWTRLPEFTKLNTTKKGIVFRLGLKTLDVPKFDFGLLFQGYIEIKTAGEYTFYTRSNDGSQLFVGDKLIVDNDNEHGVEEKQGRIFLQKGKHPIKVTYFQSGGSTELQTLYEGPGVEKQEIPAIVLFQNNYKKSN